jgi:transposase
MLHSPEYSEFVARRARLGMGMPRLRPIIRREAIPVTLPPPEPKKKMSERDVLWMADMPKGKDLPNVPKDMSIQMPSDKWKAIVRECAQKRFLTVEKMTSTDRHAPCSDARQEAAYRMCTELNMSYPAIAKRLGYRNHTSALHAATVWAARHNIRFDKSGDTDKFRKVRDAEIIRYILMGATKEEMALRYDLSLSHVQTLIIQNAKTLARRAVSRVLEE